MGALACISHSVTLVNVQLQNIKTNLFHSKLSNGFQCLYVPVKERERATYYMHFLFLTISMHETFGCCAHVHVSMKFTQCHNKGYLPPKQKTYTVSYVLHGDKKETLVTSNIITVCQACTCSVSQVSKNNVKGQSGIQVFFLIPASLLTWPHVSEADKVSNVT